MSVTIDIQKFNDPASRINALIDTFEIRLKRDFISMVSSIKSELTLSEVEALLLQGRVSEALALMDKHIQAYAAKANQAFTTSAENTAEIISGRVLVTFDLTNFRATQTMRENQLNLIRGFTIDQQEATREALVRGISQGLNPKQQARGFRDSIGLTGRQEAAVQNYRKLLEENNTESLSRSLRDKRFDRSVQTAARTGVRLSTEQIDRMTSRYRSRYLDFRAENIARTESLSAVHEGSREMYKQAVDNGSIVEDDLRRTWHTAGDGRVRDTHDGMNGQQRLFDEPFLSDAGVALQYPGDRSAPANERILCRCAVSTRLKDETA